MGIGISDLVIQARYRWQIAPLSDLFVVYNRIGDLPRQGQPGRFFDVTVHGLGVRRILAERDDVLDGLGIEMRSRRAASSDRSPRKVRK